MHRRALLLTALAALAPLSGARAQVAGRAERVTLAAPLTPGDIHVVPADFALYRVLTPETAIRYPIATPGPGRLESGSFTVGRKVEWPSWKPTPEMIARDPAHYAPYADGMPGGPDNPLGARALYLDRPDGTDSLLRIHGTNDPASIGQAVSNGCIRMLNPDVADLYDHTPLGTRVVIHPLP